MKKLNWTVLMGIGLLFAPSRVIWGLPTETHMVPMRDEIGLATDVYLPENSEGPWPVLLIRTPYERMAHEESAAQLQMYGAVTVVQNTRGRFDSEGTDCVFMCDGVGVLEDGIDTVEWLQDQSFFNGVILTAGGSAYGITQYLLAQGAPEGLEAMFVFMASGDLYSHIMFPGGVFRESLMTGWLEEQGSLSHLDTVAEHPFLDDYWNPVTCSERYANVDVPAVHVGGWYDVFSQGTIDAFMGYQYSGGQGAQGAQHLIIGPWSHELYSTQVGELAFPDNGADTPDGLDGLLFKWLAHYGGIVPDYEYINELPSVQYYVMGDVDDSEAPGNEWRESDSWPPEAEPTRFYLRQNGGLSRALPLENEGGSTYTYDPANPVPTLGGANLNISAGPVDQRSVETRDDVLTFTTSVFEEPMEISGPIKAHIWTSIDQLDTDIMVKLTDVYPDGRSMLIVDGAHRLAARGTTDSITYLEAGEIVEAVVDLWSTSIVINRGHRLRVSVSSSNWPRFRRNPNDGSNLGEEEFPIPVNVSIYHNALAHSYVELPLPDMSYWSDQITYGGGNRGCQTANSGAFIPSSTSLFMLF